jgi:hypothetical protein
MAMVASRPATNLNKADFFMVVVWCIMTKTFYPQYGNKAISAAKGKEIFQERF